MQSSLFENTFNLFIQYSQYDLSVGLLIFWAKCDITGRILLMAMVDVSITMGIVVIDRCLNQERWLKSEENIQPRVSHRKTPGRILSNLFLNSSNKSNFTTASGREFRKLHTLTVGKSLKSVELGWQQPATVFPSLNHWLFKHRGRVQPIYTSKNLKGLNGQALMTPLL